MNMWMVDPRILCRWHLLGEHKEIHMLIGHLEKQRSVDGYINNNCLELRNIEQRHDDLVQEALRRDWMMGYNHKSPITYIPDMSYLPEWQRFVRVDKRSSLRNLINRCPYCRARFFELVGTHLKIS